MLKNNDTVYNFFSGFFLIMLLLVLILAAISGAREAESNYIEPLSLNQQQEMVRQLGISGYKNAFKVKCYNSIVVRVRTERWSDGFCKKKYSHLNFAMIENSQ